MQDEIGEAVVNFMQRDLRRDYTVPEIMRGLSIKNREKVVTTLVRLQERNIIEVSKEIGRVKYYRLKKGEEGNSGASRLVLP